MDKKTWEEFRESGLLWFVNTILHLFGWAICCDIDKDNKVLRCYPKKMKCRGFEEEYNTEGYIKVTKHLKENIDTLLEDIKNY